MSLLTAAAEGQFVPPGTEEWLFPPVFGQGALSVTKPLLIVVLGALVVATFFYLAARKASLVPSRLQYAGESIYGFVRNSIAVDSIGQHGVRYAPYLATLFCLILVLNLSGIVPLLQIPPTSLIAIPAVLALIALVVFNYAGIKRHGAVTYFRTMLFPPGVPPWVYIILTPIEFVSTLIVRPITLTLRLTLNMFVGHLLLVLAVVGGEYLLLDFGGVTGVLFGSVTLFGGLLLYGFEFFVQILQAYVFTLLTALYIGGAMADEH